MTVSYIDTSVAVWLAEGRLDKISQAASEHIENYRIAMSPMVLLELEYLYEIKRTTLPSRDIQLKLERELGVFVCSLSFPAIVEFAANEKWTRDPFDRMIVSHAKAKGMAYLISSDSHIQSNYVRTVW